MRTTLWFFLSAVLVDLSCWIPKDRLIVFGSRESVFFAFVLLTGLVFCVAQDIKQLTTKKGST